MNEATLKSLLNALSVNKCKCDRFKRSEAKTCSKCGNNLAKSEAPFYVGVVLLNRDARLICLGKRSDDGTWTGPGGSANPGETPREAATRETFEETGIEIHGDEFEDLPIGKARNGKDVHCFMAMDRSMKETTSVNDPDKEVKKWRWFDLDDAMPTPMSEAKAHTIVNAKLKLRGLIKSQLNDLHKAIVMNENIPGVDLNTAEYSMDAMAAKDNPLLGMLEQAFSGMVFADVPIEVDMGENSIILSIVDFGIYSGWVKNNKSRDVMLRLEKMPLASIVQAVDAKQLYKRPAAAPVIPPQEVGPQNPEVKATQEQAPALPHSDVKLEDSMPTQIASDVTQIVENHEKQWEGQEGTPEEQEADAEAFEEVEELVEEKSSDLGQLLDGLKDIHAQEVHIHIHKSLKKLDESLNS